MAQGRSGLDLGACFDKIVVRIEITPLSPEVRSTS
jgi:hypothetical protein